MRDDRTRMERLRDWWHQFSLAAWAADRLPRSVAYWAAIRVGAEAACSGQHANQTMTDLTMSAALDRWAESSGA